MEIEYKAVGVKALSAVKDEGNGVVSAIVSVTGIVDNVKDRILPGAYEKTLKKRKPKGVWHHSWLDPISKTLAAEELLPGHPDLPKSLPDGTPWPKEAGGLRIKTQFNLNTSKGRDSYENVIFYGDEQEWSIGYQVPKGKATHTKDGIREIHELDLYEYSPVLFGAMPAARTLSVKDAQEAFREVKQLHGEEAEAFLMEMKSFVGEEVFEAKRRGGPLDDDEELAPDDEQGLSFIPEIDDIDDDLEDDELDDEVGASLSAAQAEDIENAISALQAILDRGAPRSYSEKSWSLYEVKGLDEIAEDADLPEDLVEKASEFDSAASDLDEKTMLAYAEPIIEHIEREFEEGRGTKELAFVSNYIAAAFKEAGFEDEDQDEEEDDESQEEQPQEVEEDTKVFNLDEVKSLLSDIDLT